MFPHIVFPCALVDDCAPPTNPYRSVKGPSIPYALAAATLCVARLAVQTHVLARRILTVFAPFKHPVYTERVASGKQQSARERIPSVPVRGPRLDVVLAVRTLSGERPVRDTTFKHNTFYDRDDRSRYHRRLYEINCTYSVALPCRLLELCAVQDFKDQTGQKMLAKDRTDYRFIFFFLYRTGLKI